MQLSWSLSLQTANADMLIGVTVQDADFSSWLQACGLAPASLPGRGDVRGGKNELTVLHVPGGTPIPRVCVIGLGKLETSNIPVSRDELLGRLRAAVGAALVKARELRLSRVAFAVDSLKLLGLPAHENVRAVREAVFGAQAGLYRYTALKTDRDLPLNPEELCLVSAAAATPVVEAAAARALLEAESVALVQDLVNTPANMLTPGEFADKAWELCAGLPVTCSVLDEEALRKGGMNALLAVAQGSAEEAVMVCLEYAPEGHEQEDPLVLVGKGLFFDSGGISLKPGLGMHEMKSDMAGAAAVLAAVLLAARLDAPRRVIGLLPCAENMPDALAIRPGDVINTLSGKTVEVINTDAEGRLVLCDALTYAQKAWKPSRMVDVATLTGACIVALGTEVAGLFATDDALASDIATLGAVCGERFWRMPLWDLYAENLKSPTADYANVGPREGGAVTAALFLKQFVEPGVAWAHLDIAGPAYAKKGAGREAGGTGFAVRTLAELACGEG